MSHYDTVVHLAAGGLGGTAGAIATCPLEVVKTRLQSSVANFNFTQVSPSINQKFQYCTCAPRDFHSADRIVPLTTQSAFKPSFTILRCIRHIIETEGTRALFKGLGPNLVGVAPSRAIYFCTYSQTKNFCNSKLTPDTPLVHICSAACAGFTSCTITSPIWFVKTRLQLDQREYGRTSTLQCIRDVYNSKGLRGFYKGITASYFGISETIIHFVIYEFLKANFRKYGDHSDFSHEDKSTRDFLGFMLAGAVSKTCASSLTYPHEVVRTRLRQEGNKYHSFFQTLFLVFREEGYHGLYRGLATQLVRQIPNTAIMMTVYEAVVYLFANYPYPVPTIQICEDEEEQY